MNFELWWVAVRTADVLVVAALRSEVAGVLERARVCLTGVGIHQARRKLREELEQGATPKLILSAGLSGALRADLRTGEIVLAKKIVFGEKDYQTSRLSLPRVVHRVGAVYCSSRSVSRREERLAISTESGALCVDMESGAVAEVAFERGIPVAAIRVVMDSVDDVVADFESPRKPRDRAAVREAIKADMAGHLGAKAELAIESLDRALQAFLGTLSPSG